MALTGQFVVTSNRQGRGHRKTTDTSRTNWHALRCCDMTVTDVSTTRGRVLCFSTAASNQARRFPRLPRTLAAH